MIDEDKLAASLNMACCVLGLIGGLAVALYIDYLIFCGLNFDDPTDPETGNRDVFMVTTGALQTLLLPIISCVVLTVIGFFAIECCLSCVKSTSESCGDCTDALANKLTSVIGYFKTKVVNSNEGSVQHPEELTNLLPQEKFTV